MCTWPLLYPAPHPPPVRAGERRKESGPGPGPRRPVLLGRGHRQQQERGGAPGGAPLVSPSVPRIQGCPGHPDLQRSCPLTSTLKSLSVTPRARVPTSRRSQAEGLARLRTMEVARGGHSTYPCARQVQGSWVQREIPRETWGRREGEGEPARAHSSPSSSPPSIPLSVLSPGCPHVAHLSASFPAVEELVPPPGGQVWDGRLLDTDSGS